MTLKLKIRKATAHMKVFRAILVGLAGFFFLFFVFGALVLGVMNLTIGGPQQLKVLLKDGKVYDTVVPALLKEVSKQQAKEQANNGDGDNKVPIDKPEIVAAAQKGFSPQLLQKNTELAIDGIFSWLNGTTPTPKFSLDFASGKDGFADGVGQYATNYLKGLPVCTAAQGQNEPDDAFSAVCRPANLNADQQGAKITDNLKNNGEIFKNTTITSESLKLDEKAHDKLKQVPTIYKIFKFSPLILTSLAVLSALIIVFASSERRKGLIRVATSLEIAGVVVLLSVVAVNLVRTFLNKKILTAGTDSAGFMTDTMTPLLNKAAAMVNRTNVIIGVLLIVLSTAILVSLRLTRPKGTNPVSNETPVKEEDHGVVAAKKIVAATETPAEKPTSESAKPDKKPKA